MPERFEIKKAANGQFYFVLIAPNNEVIAKSEMYTTKDACRKGIESVKRHAPTASVAERAD